MPRILLHIIDDMALIQVRDVSDETVRALKTRAAERRLTLAAFLRTELDRLAARPTNADIVERMARRDRSSGPTVEDTVEEIRRLRASS
jgi:antitoxin FitA